MERWSFDLDVRMLRDSSIVVPSENEVAGRLNSFSAVDTSVSTNSFEVGSTVLMLSFQGLILRNAQLVFVFQFSRPGVTMNSLIFLCHQSFTTRFTLIVSLSSAPMAARPIPPTMHTCFSAHSSRALPLCSLRLRQSSEFESGPALEARQRGWVKQVHFRFNTVYPFC